VLIQLAFTTANCGGLGGGQAGWHDGMTLSDYAKAHGLEVRPVYDAIAALRRRGALPGTDQPRKRKSKFVAVRVTSSSAPVTEVAPAWRSGLVCRVVCAQGWAIECGEWPAPSWVSAVLAGRGDAAPDRGIERVYLHRAPVDMRKQISRSTAWRSWRET